MINSNNIKEEQLLIAIMSDIQSHKSIKYICEKHKISEGRLALIKLHNTHVDVYQEALLDEANIKLTTALTTIYLNHIKRLYQLGAPMDCRLPEILLTPDIFLNAVRADITKYGA